MRYLTLNQQARNRGIALLIGLILVAVLLLISAAITTFAFKSLRLTDTATQSQYAFYAADGAAECALYWHNQKNAFCDGADGLNTIRCYGWDKPLDVDYTDGDNSCDMADNESHSWRVSDPGGSDVLTVDNGPACATVEIRKTSEGEFIVDSRGRSNCSGGSGRIRAERGVKIIESENAE